MNTIRWCLTVAGGVALLAMGAAFAADVPAGQKVFLDAKCNSCHTLKAAKIEKRKAATTEEGEETSATSTTTKKQPPDLSGAGIKRDAAWIEGWLLRKELVDGKKHKKKFTGTPEEAKTVSAWLATMKVKADEVEKKAAP
jgi:mono/diheme cytochrome c family protein